MKQKNTFSSLAPFLALRIILGIVILSYFVLGLAGLIGGDTAERTIALFFGASVTLTSQLAYIISLVSVFMLGIGVLGIFAWNNPVQNRAIITGIAVLLLLRVAQKAIFFDDIQELFGLSTGRIIMGSGLYLILALLLLYLRPRQ